MNNAATIMKSAQPLNGADAQTFLSTVDEMCSSVKLTAMSLMLQQPTVDSMGLTASAIKSLTSQREMVVKLSQTAVTKVSTEVVPVVQASFGEAISAVDFCLSQIQGGGSVVVEMGSGGQVPECGAQDMKQQCMDIGWAPINAITDMEGMEEKDQEKLVQYCDAMGLVPAEQCMQAPPEEEQPPLEDEQPPPEEDDQGLEKQCMDAGLVKQDEAQGADQGAVEQCAAIGYVEAGMDDAGQNGEAAMPEGEAAMPEGEAPMPEGEAPKPEDGGVAQGAYRLRKRTEPAAPAGDSAGGEQAAGDYAGGEEAAGDGAGQDDLNQQCAAIGFVEQQAEEEFEASPEACAGMGLVMEDEGQAEEGQGEEGQDENQDIAQQCAALGLQPGVDAGGDEQAGEGEDQQADEGDDQQADEGDDQQADEGDDQQDQGDDAAADEEMNDGGDDAAEGEEQNDDRGDEGNQAAEGKKQRRTRRSRSRRTDEAAAGQDQGAEQGQVSKEDCLAMGFVEMGDAEQGDDAAADEGAGEDASGEEAAGEDAAGDEDADEDAGGEAEAPQADDAAAQQPPAEGNAAAAPPAAAGTYKRSSFRFGKWRI